MHLYLIRHAHAIDLAPDHARPLSARGEDQVRVLARFLRRSESFDAEEIWHSTLRRAHETAKLLVEGIRREMPCREVTGLAPEDDPAAFAPTLLVCKRPVAVVGHEPHLSALASLLVRGEVSPPVFAMKKGAVLALERAGRYWIVRWHVFPDLMAAG